jgi:hypothetical protein
LSPAPVGGAAGAGNGMGGAALGPTVGQIIDNVSLSPAPAGGAGNSGQSGSNTIGGLLGTLQQRRGANQADPNAAPGSPPSQGLVADNPLAQPSQGTPPQTGSDANTSSDPGPVVSDPGEIVVGNPQQQPGAVSPAPAATGSPEPSNAAGGSPAPGSPTPGSPAQPTGSSPAPGVVPQTGAASQASSQLLAWVMALLVIAVCQV